MSNQLTAAISALTLCFGLASAGPVLAAAPLETETARFAPAGTFENDSALEVQWSGDGREAALPLAFEYALSDRLELLAEPVPFTSINPRSGSATRGPGDFEVTLNGLVLPEKGSRPALALAGEIKIPSGKSPTIGSGEYDYTAYAIASKRFGRWDLHANLGYTVVGRPPGVDVTNTFNYAVAAEYELTPRWGLVGEVLSTTSAVSETADTGESLIAPEVSGGETVGMIGGRWRFARKVSASFGVTVDNTGAVLLRPGISFKF
jgi:hypothetical protein